MDLHRNLKGWAILFGEVHCWYNILAVCSSFHFAYNNNLNIHSFISRSISSRILLLVSITSHRLKMSLVVWCNLKQSNILILELLHAFWWQSKIKSWVTVDFYVLLTNNRSHSYCAMERSHWTSLALEIHCYLRIQQGYVIHSVFFFFFKWMAIRFLLPVPVKSDCNIRRISNQFREQTG